MSKTTGPKARTAMMGSTVVQFKIDYEQSKQLPIGKRVDPDVFSAGGHSWRIECFPRGSHKENKGDHLSIYVRHMSKTGRVKAIVDAILMDRDGEPCIDTHKSFFHDFPIKKNNGDADSHDWGWIKFISAATLAKYVTEGHVTFVCAIIVLCGSSISVPPSDIGVHLGYLLDHKDGTDVSFIVEGETFCAHRAVLAARSPVFRAELFGSMAEATMSCITLHDITPTTFKVMLRFIYTDDLPGEGELGDSPFEMFQNLLMAADRYALDRLKIICAQKLWDKVSVDTVATILACAETYNCPELKSKCIDFLTTEENFKKAVFTEGYALLVLKFPSIVDELRNRVTT